MPVACESYRCSSFAEKMEVQSDYTIGVGCMIKIKDQWVPLKSYRILD